MILDRPIVRMPEFSEGTWLNSSQPLSRRDLKGQVLLIDFWEYTCVNCIRTLPYLAAWHRRYAQEGLTIIGIHTPEFHFGRLEQQVAAAVADLEVAYPILLDNSYKNWDRFAVKAWPTKILVDARGYIRLRRRGEGHYATVERAIQTLLLQRDADTFLPDLLPPLREEDAPGAVCYRPTPELYAGYQGGGLFGGALGNPEGYVAGSPMVYELPPAEDRSEGQFYLEGFWSAQPEAVVFAGQEGGRVLVPYQAAQVNAVMSPSTDTVELLLDLRPSDVDPVVEVRQDGRHLDREIAGRDIQYDERGRSFTRIERSKMVNLVNNQSFGRHQLELIFHASQLALYTFSFTGCVAGDEPTGDAEVYRVE